MRSLIIFFFAFSFLSTASSCKEKHTPVIREATIRFYNTTVYPVRLAYYYEPTSDSSLIKGWIKLDPGERSSVHVTYRDTIPNFSVYVESTDPDMVRWLYQLPYSDPGKITFTETEQSVSYQIEELDFYKREVKLPSKRFFSRLFSNKNSMWAKFVPIPFTDTSSTWNGEYIIRDDITPSIYNEAGLNISGDVRTALTTRSRLLSYSLRRQKEFHERWPYPSISFKYYPGFQMNDHNGIDYPGVTIHSVTTQTIMGDPVYFQDGDILISFNNTTVYGEADVYSALYKHATDLSKGIREPFTAKVQRGVNVYNITSLYFFNDGYYPYNKADESRAFKYGLLTGIGGDNMIEVYTAIEGIFKESRLTEEQINFWRTQELFRLRQQYSHTIAMGEFFGYIVPVGRILGTQRLLSRQLMRVGLSYGAAATAGAIMHELAHGVYQTIGTASPLQSTEDILQDLKSNLKNNMPLMITSVVLSASLPQKKTGLFNY